MCQQDQFLNLVRPDVILCGTPAYLTPSKHLRKATSVFPERSPLREHNTLLLLGWNVVLLSLHC